MPDESSEWQKELLQRQKLGPSYLASAQYWFDPLADALVAQHKEAGKPVLIAFNGSQGSGKSTLCAYLEMAIANKHELRALTLSLDDFYYSRDRRLALSQEIHPLLATRGVPGTHDMALLKVTLDNLLDMNSCNSVDIPRFDKAADDRCAEPEQVSGPVDIVLLEGWCLGARPQPIEDLVEPINALEKVDDPDGIWRNYVNGVLARDFLPLYQRVDRWVMLQAPGFDCVFQWRLEQEQKLARFRDARGGRRIMDEEQMARFIQFYERLTKTCLSQLPRLVHYLYVLDETRGIRASQLREELPD